MKPLVYIYVVFAMLFFSESWGQTNFEWRDEAANGNWHEPTNWWDGDAPTLPGFGVMRFNNNHELEMDNNNTGSVFETHAIFFLNSNNLVRTINGDPIRLFDFGGANPFIQNNSPATHNINVLVQGDGDTGDPLVVRIAGSGGLNFNGPVNNEGSNINIQGSTSSSTTVAFNDIISGSGGLRKDNSNILLDFAAANTFSGELRIVAGEVRLINSSATFGDSNDVLIGNGGVLNLNGFDANVRSVGEIGFADGGTISLSSGTLTLSGGFGSRFQNSISGTGGFVKNGTGEITLYGDQTYSGTTTINGGVVATEVDLASSEIIVNDGGTFKVTNSNTVTINDLTLTDGATLNLEAGSILNVTGEFEETNINITGTGELRVIRTTIQNGNWDAQSTWENDRIPDSEFDYITINHEVNLNDSRSVPQLIISSSGDLSVASSETLSIIDGGRLENNGDFQSNESILEFLGSGSISGTLSLNDVVLNNGGVSFGTTCTINGNLTLNSGSFVNVDSPIYAPGSTLIYNAGSTVVAPYQRRSEWSNADPQGTPYNVILQNDTAVNLGFERENFDAIMKGNLSIDAGSFMLMDFGDDNMTASLIVEGNFLNNGQISLSNELNGDLKVFGNFTNNGTFQDNGRALFLEGGSVQNLNANTEFKVPFLIIAKTNGEVTLNQDIIISGNGDGLQMSDQAILKLNGNQLQIGNASNTSVVFNDDSALKASNTSRIRFNSTNASAGTLIFSQTDGEHDLAVFEMDGSGGISISDTLNIYEQFILKNGTFTSNGNLTLKSSATKTAIIPEVLGGSISGNIRVERYFSDTNRSFRYISSAVDSEDNIRANWQEGVNNMGTNYPADNENPNPGFGTHITGSTNGDDGFDATLTGNPSMFTWSNIEQEWSAIPNTNATNLEAGRAYALMVRGNRSTDLNSNDAQGGETILRSFGTPVSGTFEISASGMPQAAEEFALIGNPYQAQVDVKGITTTGLNTNFIYIWDPNIGNTGGYTTIDLSEDPVATTPASGANERLQPGQAFFIETTAASSSVTFEESHKTEDILNTSTFSMNATPEIYVALSKENSSSAIDATRVVFGDQFSEAVTFEDAKKLWNNEEYIAISKADYWLAVEKKTFVNNDTIQLFTGNYFSSEYQLAIGVNNVDTHDVFLRDRYLDEVYALGNTETYVHNFTVDYAISESVANERFQLILEEIPLSTISEIQPEIKIYPNPVFNETISIENSFQQGEIINLAIYDMLGKELTSSEIEVNSSSIEWDVSFLKTGIFILQLQSENLVTSQKLIVK